MTPPPTAPTPTAASVEERARKTSSAMPSRDFGETSTRLHVAFLANDIENLARIVTAHAADLADLRADREGMRVAARELHHDMQRIAPSIGYSQALWKIVEAVAAIGPPPEQEQVKPQPATASETASFAEVPHEQVAHLLSDKPLKRPGTPIPPARDAFDEQAEKIIGESDRGDIEIKPHDGRGCVWHFRTSERATRDALYDVRRYIAAALRAAAQHTAQSRDAFDEEAERVLAAYQNQIHGVPYAPQTLMSIIAAALRSAHPPDEQAARREKLRKSSGLLRIHLGFIYIGNGSWRALDLATDGIPDDLNAALDAALAGAT